MVIIVEKAHQFDLMPDSLQKIADKYIIGKEFNSLEEIFLQDAGRYDSVGSKGFYIAESKVWLKNLPEIIREAYIFIRYSDCKNSYDYHVLTAKLKSKK